MGSKGILTITKSLSLIIVRLIRKRDKKKPYPKAGALTGLRYTPKSLFVLIELIFLSPYQIHW